MTTLRASARFIAAGQSTLRKFRIGNNQSRSFSSEEPRPLLVIKPDMFVLDALKYMSTNKAGSVLIQTNAGKPAINGIFTERDYLTKLKLHGRPSESTTVGDVMSSPLICADAHTTVTEKGVAMVNMHLRHLPVLTAKASNPNHDNPIRKASGPIAVDDITKLISIKDILRSMKNAVDGLKVSGGPDPLAAITTQNLVRPEQSVGISPDASVLDAVNKMVERNVGALVILDGTAARHAVGIFTERDYLTKVILAGHSSVTLKVRDVMTANPVFVSPDCTFEEVLTKLTTHHFRHLPVDGGDGKLAGVVSARDLLRVITLPENVGVLEATAAEMNY